MCAVSTTVHLRVAAGDEAFIDLMESPRNYQQCIASPYAELSQSVAYSCQLYSMLLVVVRGAVVARVRCPSRKLTCCYRASVSCMT